MAREGLRVLVTGGAGYVGTAVCEALSSEGHCPVVLDVTPPKKSGTAYVRADVRDSLSVFKALESNRIDSLVHCAALVSVSESFLRPHDYASCNAGGTIALMDAVRRYGAIESMVLASSAAVYGTAHPGVISEEEAACPISPYGESKLEAERIMSQTAEDMDAGCCILRLFNVAGSWGAASDRPESGHLVPVVADSISSRRGLNICGADWATSDGTCIRDYVHVRDVGRAFVLAATAVGGRIGAVNIGSGKGTSVLEVIDAAEALEGYRPVIHNCDRRNGDPPCLVASINKAERELGWTPQHSSIGEILDSVFAYSRSLFRCL